MNHLNDTFNPDGESAEFYYQDGLTKKEIEDNIYAEIDRAYSLDPYYALLGIDDLFPEHGVTRAHPCGKAYFGNSQGF